MAKNIQNLIRVANTDLDSSKAVRFALNKIKGIGDMMANAICKVMSIDTKTKLSDLSETDIKKIEEIINDPLKAGIPLWLVNRRNDPETGEDEHLVTTNLKLTTEDDIKLMKKIKSYKGLRHQKGLTVRGQRNQANARPNKGKLSRIKKKR